MQGVLEFLQWFEVQNQILQWVVIVIAFAFLILVARTSSRWLGGKK
jgi:hypothetical protein